MKLLEVLKRVFSAAIVMAASLAHFTSCDSREDWFAKEGEGVMFVIKTYKCDRSDVQSNPEKYAFRTDTVYSQNSRVVTYDLNVLYLNSMGYGSVSLGIDIEGVGQKIENESGSEWSITSTYPTPQTSVDYYGLDGDKHKEIHFAGLYEIPGVNNDTVAILLNTADVIMELRDAFRNRVYCHIKVNLWSDIPPIPVMEVKDINGSPMEKVLCLNKSYDKDGSVYKYEYCIDGNVREYNYPKFEKETDYSGGKGAYGGTYITSTELSEVKYAFQTKGEHIVYFRCMDNLGLWSQWKSVIVTIE